MTAGPGHNRGPALDAGLSWRRHCWSRSRRSLLGAALPVEVIRNRVRRARELGLDYQTYASVRASTGRDVIGFLFSTNALRITVKAPILADQRRDHLAEIRSRDRLCLVRAPLRAAATGADNAGAPLDMFVQAPAAWASWGEARDTIRTTLGARKLPGDAVVLVGDDWIERDWAEAARLAGYLSAQACFGN